MTVLGNRNKGHVQALILNQSISVAHAYPLNYNFMVRKTRAPKIQEQKCAEMNLKHRPFVDCYCTLKGPNTRILSIFHIFIMTISLPCCHFNSAGVQAFPLDASPSSMQDGCSSFLPNGKDIDSHLVNNQKNPLLDLTIDIKINSISMPKSCNDQFERDPHSSSGWYVIDVDGAGIKEPFVVFCEMESSGGWTRLFFDDFNHTPVSKAWSRNGAQISTCGAFGNILGGYNILGKKDNIILKNTLQGLPHTKLRVKGDLLVIDTWDSEKAYIEIDGTQMLLAQCNSQVPYSCGQQVQQCGRNSYDDLAAFDGKVSFDFTQDHVANSFEIRFYAILDQAKDDESWGLDNVSVSVK